MYHDTKKRSILYFMTPKKDQYYNIYHDTKKKQSYQKAIVITFRVS